MLTDPPDTNTGAYQHHLTGIPAQTLYAVQEKVTQRKYKQKSVPFSCSRHPSSPCWLVNSKATLASPETNVKGYKED